MLKTLLLAIFIYAIEPRDDGHSVSLITWSAMLSGISPFWGDMLYLVGRIAGVTRSRAVRSWNAEDMNVRCDVAVEDVCPDLAEIDAEVG